ncbi:class B sortase [Peribacillus sp. JNUCC 23]
MGLIRKLLILICLGVAVFSLFELSRTYMDQKRNKQLIAKAQEYYMNETLIPKDDTEEIPISKDHNSETVIPKEDDAKTNKQEVRSQFHSLLNLNTDIVGWLEIDHTQINYPIVQADDNTYYLHRNTEREEMAMGSIFMDYRNDISTNMKHTILYGHRMKNGSMFGELDQYLDNEFFQKNRHFQYDTLYEGFEAEIFSVYMTTTDFDYIQTDFADQKEYASFLQMIQDKSLFPTDTVVGADDSILTLSTCDYTLDKEEGRLVIHAKLKKKDDHL